MERKLFDLVERFSSRQTNFKNSRKENKCYFKRSPCYKMEQLGAVQVASNPNSKCLVEIRCEKLGICSNLEVGRDK